MRQCGLTFTLTSVLTFIFHFVHFSSRICGNLLTPPQFRHSELDSRFGPRGKRELVALDFGRLSADGGLRHPLPRPI